MEIHGLARGFESRLSEKTSAGCSLHTGGILARTCDLMASVAFRHRACDFVEVLQRLTCPPLSGRGTPTQRLRKRPSSSASTVATSAVPSGDQWLLSYRP
jgi:hypothetical protein